MIGAPAVRIVKYTMTLQYPTIADCVGNTPLVRLQRIAGQTSNTLLLKLEGNNPAGSVKDRPALSMITRAELRGQIKPGDTLIEATSGNTGIALAMAAAIKGYRMILIMPDNSTAERKAAMTAYGAELILVPTANMAPYDFTCQVTVRARAQENQCYLVYANYCGAEGQIQYCGQSSIIAPDGSLLAMAGHDECLLLAELEHERVVQGRAAFPYLSDLRQELHLRQG